MKRISYLKKMRNDLAIAVEAKLHPAIVAEIQERIDAHIVYKAAYHKKNYISRKVGK
jgi:hypothetical protein